MEGAEGPSALVLQTVIARALLRLCERETLNALVRKPRLFLLVSVLFVRFAAESYFFVIFYHEHTLYA